MKLIVGLGNPGPKYETTRHNIGFLCIDYLVEEYKASGPVIKNQAEVWSAKIDGEPVLFIKPQTYMNLSGRAVAPFFQFYKCEPSEVIVIHDELDFAPNDVRFKTGGSAGGHNGLKSMDECLGADHTNYHRVRLGIGHPRNFNLQMDVSDWVLGKIPDSDWAELSDVFKKVDGGIRLILKGKILEAMSRFHAKPKPII
jgi:PTH1 family peptidyl-tRNA hydrolase